MDEPRAQPDNGTPDGQGDDSVGEARAFLALCVAYLDGDATAEDVRSIEREIAASPARRGDLVRLAGVRARLAEMLAGAGAALPSPSRTPAVLSFSRPACGPRPGDTNERTGDIADAAIGPTTQDADPPMQLCPPPDLQQQLPAAWRAGRWRASRSRRIAWAAAIGALLLSTVGYLVRSGWDGNRPIASATAADTQGRELLARVVATVDADWGERGTPAGRGLTDQPFELRSGLAEVRLSSGVSMVVRGPAALRVASADEVRLESGSLTATVPPAARGFAVQTAGARIVDLGTVFGVTAAKGQTETFVLQGSVHAYPMTAGTDRSPVLCTAGNGAIVNVDGARFVIGEALPGRDQYVANIRAVRQAVPAYGTGHAFDPATGADLHWQVAAEADGQVGPFEAAYATYDPHYQPNEPTSLWISLRDPRRVTPADRRFRFRTTFDLAGFDPATVRLAMQLGADDAIENVYLNGRPLGIALAQYNVHRLTEFVVDRGFVDGVNALEIAVLNIGERGGDSIFALRAKLDGTAVRRAIEAMPQ